MFAADPAASDLRLVGPTHDISHDMSCDEVRSVPRDRDGHRDESSDDGIADALLRIEDRIEAIEDELAECAPLLAERERLLRARGAILGIEPERGPHDRATRVSRDDVAAFLAAAPGSRAGEIARGLGTSQQVVSAHLYRGKRVEFDKRGGRWFLRGT